MIITFSVQNFRSIRDKITLDFRATTDTTLSKYYVFEIPKPKIRILKMAMIYGLNASGKSNVLKALDFLRSFILMKEVDKENLINVDTFALDNDLLTHFEIEFYHAEIVYCYKLELNRQAIHYESLTHYPKGSEASVFERNLVDDNENSNYIYSWLGAKLSQEHKKFLALTVQNQSILSRLRSIKYSGPIQEARNWFGKVLDPLVEPRTNLVSFGLKHYIDNAKASNDYRKFYLQQLKNADFLIDDIEVKKEEIDFSKLPEVVRRFIENQTKNAEKIVDALDKVEQVSIMLSHKVGMDSYNLDFEEESAGTQRYFEFLGLLCELVYKNCVVPIDEIESALHIDLLLHFIEIFLRNSNIGQLIFTSHNTALLNMREVLRRDAVWITNRKSDGSTELNSVSEFPVRKENAIDRLYRKGLLGGIPNLGSTLLDDKYEDKTE